MAETLEELKQETVDPILSSIIVKRVIYHERINDRVIYEPLMKELEPVVREIINPALLEIIRSGGIAVSDAPTAGGGRNYKKEDEVTFAVRKLVEFEHGIHDRKLVRAMTAKCMDFIGGAADSVTFNNRLRIAKAKIISKFKPRSK